MSSEFVLTQGAGQKLEFAVNRNGGTATDIDWLSTGENFKSVMLLASGEAGLVLKAEPVPEVVIEATDSIIRADRSIRPAYPGWMKEIIHPELENTGPAEFDAGKLELWLHDGQKNGKCTKGQVIYEYLKEKKMLKSCLGLRDLEEIRKRGIIFFRKHFAGKAVFAWKSVVRYLDGGLFAPYLYDDGGEVVLYWCWLEYDWFGVSLALRLAS